jgi:tetratricopeptide (TPR) repeat protein
MYNRSTTRHSNRASSKKSLKSSKSSRLAADKLLSRVDSHETRAGTGDMQGITRSVSRISTVSIMSEKDLEINAKILLDHYIDQMKELWLRKKLHQAIAVCFKMKALVIKVGDMLALQCAYKFLGDLYLDMNDLQNAIHSYRQRKGLAEANQDYKDKMKTYRKLGHCYKLIKNYKLALVNYKKMLQLAWELKDENAELIAYDGIGMQYFYLGAVDKARYYHERMWKGVYENDSSAARVLSHTSLMMRRKKKYNYDEESASNSNRAVKNIWYTHEGKLLVNISGDTEDHLPSPRAKASSGSIKLLPHYRPKGVAEMGALQTSRSATAPLRSKSARQGIRRKLEEKKGLNAFRYLSHLSTIDSLKNFNYIS